jgi:peptidyl-prolyl cis-trans isomerase C
MLIKSLLSAILMLVVAAAMSACGNKEKKAGQALARVDGEEITMLQLNEELQRINVQPGQQEEANKQLLESLIDRQLIISEAVRNKIDRTPEVMQAIARSKTQIITQAYLQGVASKITKPTRAEVEEYYLSHPDFFANRKQFLMTSIIISTKDFSDELKSVMTTAKSLNTILAWMNERKLPYKSGQLTRTSADLPPEVSAKLIKLPKGNLFVVNEGVNTMLISVISIKDHPISAIEAAAQIEQYLAKKKTKEVAEIEIAHLRSLAKIEYLNASALPATGNKVTAYELPTPDTKPANGENASR